MTDRKPPWMISGSNVISTAMFVVFLPYAVVSSVEQDTLWFAVLLVLIAPVLLEMSMSTESYSGQEATSYLLSTLATGTSAGTVAQVESAVRLVPPSRLALFLLNGAGADEDYARFRVATEEVFARRGVTPTPSPTTSRSFRTDPTALVRPGRTARNAPAGQEPSACAGR